jgi:hypothetical protein
MVVAMIALAVALGGTGYAALVLPANSVGTKQIKDGAVANRDLHPQAVTGDKVANNSLTGAQINLSTLGTVPNAAHASSADHATKADHAGNSDQLAGSPASSYLAHCPAGLKRAPKSDLCFDFTTRPFATWTDALKTCALAGLRLPDAGELVQAFNDVDAFQVSEWTSSQFNFLNANGAGVAAAATLSQDASRKISVNADLITAVTAYRCVTTATN